MMTVRRALTVSPRRARGFTLIELMVAIFISTIVFLVGFAMIASAQRAQLSSSYNLRTAENARLFFDMLERDLAGAYPADYSLSGELNLSRVDFLINHPSASGSDADTLCFFTKLDHTFSADAVTYVRYYVIKNAKFPERSVLCRDVLPGYLHSGETTLNAPTGVTPSSAASSALFDSVYSVQFVYRQWIDSEKRFDPALTDTPDMAPGTQQNATHILVRLMFVDPDSKGLPRMFQKAIAIPPAFLQKG
jgi:prepilin-type N-terminal cleavage/methylation domain-containing protein